MDLKYHKRKLTIAVDFDGTCVTHEYPKIGKDIGAAPVLRELVKEGHRIILYTMRSGKTLKEAEEWFKKNGIPLYAVNCNPEQKSWTDSPKVYADMYIDDASVGAYLIHVDGLAERDFISWQGVCIDFLNLGILNKEDTVGLLKEVYNDFEENRTENEQ